MDIQRASEPTTGLGDRPRDTLVAPNMNNIPTGRTYLGFVLTWIVALFLVSLFCIGLFGAGRWIAGLLTILLTVYGLVRHSLWIGKRAKRGLVRRR